MVAALSPVVSRAGGDSGLPDDDQRHPVDVAAAVAVGDEEQLAVPGAARSGLRLSAFPPATWTGAPPSAGTTMIALGAMLPSWERRP